MKLVLLLSFLAVASAASLGSEKCTWGPAYWCDHPLKAKECGEGATSYCIANDWAQLTVDDDSACDDCKLFIAAVKDVLNSATVQSDIVSVVKELCNKLGSEAIACKLAVDLYGMKFLEALITDLDASKVCTLLDLCKSTTPIDVIHDPLPLLHVNLMADPCGDCKQIFSDLDDILSNKSVEQFVFNQVIQLCEEVGLPVDTCKTYVMQFGPDVFNYIIELIDGDTICTDLGVCKSLIRFDFLKKVPKLSADPCTDCKQIFSDLDDLLSNSSVQKFVEKEVLQACTEAGLPTSICQLVDQFVPEALQYLVSFLDGNMICSELGVCASTGTFNPKKLLMKLGKVPKLSADPCTDCKQIFSDLDDLLSNSSVQKFVEKEVLQACTEAGLPASICQLVDQFVPEALQYLVSFLDGDMICSELGVCASTGTFNPKKLLMKLGKVPKLSADPCTDCKQIFSDLDDLLSNSSVQKFVEKEVLQACTEAGLPASICQLVDQFVPEALQYLVSFLDGDMICSELGVCASTGTFNPKKLLMKLGKVPKLSADPCTDCKQIFSDLDDLLSNSSVQKFVEKEVLQACTEAGLPASICQLVDQFVPEALQYLVSFLDGDMICSELGVCASTGTFNPKKLSPKLGKITAFELVPAKPVLPPSAGSITVDPTENCIMCQFISDVLKLQYPTGATSAQLETAMYMDCKDLAIQKNVKLCNAFVTNWADRFIKELIADKFDYDKVCVGLKICPDIVSESKPSINESTCVMCEFMVDFLTSFLPSNFTKADIEADMTKSCTLLPDDFKVLCGNFVSQYGDQIVSLLMGMVPFEDVCSEMNVCPSLAANPVLEKTQVGYVDHCEICKLIMKELEALVKKNAAEKDIQNFLDNICDALPADLKTSCDDFITKYTRTIFVLLKTVFPDGICQILALCTSSNVANPVLEKTQVGNVVYCDICKLVMKELEALVERNATVKDIEHFLDNICDVLPADLKTSCDDFISKYTKAILALLKNIPPDEICQMLVLCTSSNVANPVLEKTQVGNVIYCDICKLVMKELEALVERNATVKDIEHFLDNICDVLPAELKTSCDDFISKYTKAILALLKNFPPDKICQMLALCTSSNVEAKVSETGGGIGCGPCEMVAEVVENILKEGTTLKEMEAFLKTKVCPKLPGEAETECLNFVDQYLSKILALVTSMTPEELCGFLGLCSSADTLDKMVEAAIDSTAECMICELIVKEMRTGLSQNATQAEIEKFLGTVCSKIPLSTLAKDCQEFVNDYTKPIVQYLLAEMDPGKICDLLKVCDQTKITSPIGKVDSDALCLVCDVLFGILETQLATNKTLEELTQLIENVCTLLPASLDQQCKGFLDLYGPMLLKLIVDSKLSPNDICKDLRLCTANTPLQSRLAFTSGSIQCDACHYVVILVESVIKGGTEVILELVSKLCELLPEAYQQQCKNYVTVYGSYILDLIIGEFFTPDTVCKVLRLCDQSGISLPPTNKCALGPVFWCANMDNAKLCNTVEHCHRHAWN